MTGTLYVLVHDDLVVLPDLTWPGPGFDIQVIGGTQSTIRRTVSGGVLTVTGESPPQPPNIAAAQDGELTFKPEDPCGPHTTALVLIEPDLGISPPILPPADLETCVGKSTELPMVFPANLPAMTEQAFYNLLVQGLNQVWANDNVTVTYDPTGGDDGEGIIAIDQPGCPTTSGAAALICK